MLDLCDRAIFMETGLVPTEGHWSAVCEIRSVDFIARLRLEVVDKNSEVPDKPLIIAFYVDNTPNDQEQIRQLWRQCRLGSTIFLLDPMPHHFMDGTWGVRVEDLSTVKVSFACWSRQT